MEKAHIPNGGKCLFQGEIREDFLPLARVAHVSEIEPAVSHVGQSLPSSPHPGHSKQAGASKPIVVVFWPYSHPPVIRPT